MPLPHREQHVAAWPSTRPQAKIFASGCWALALARRRHASWHGRGLGFDSPLATTLPIAPLLRAPLLLAVRTGPVPLAGLPTPPTPCRLATTFAAITCLRMGRPELLFTAFQKATPTPTTTAVWSRANTPKKMTPVHGSLLLPLVKSRSEAFYFAPRRFHLHLSMTSTLNHKGQSRDQAIAAWPGPQRAFGPISERC